MNERTKTGLEILQVALILGVLGDVLLRSVPWGLNVLLFNAAFAAGMFVLLRRHAPEYLTRHTMALFGALIFFATMFIWRDSAELRVADTFAIVAILSVLFLPRMKIATQVAGVFHYVVAFFWSAINAWFAPFVLLFADIKWAQTPSSGWRKHAGSVFRGIAVAAPLLLIFGALFKAADAVFEGWVQSIFNLPENMTSHIVLFGLFSWLTAGYLRGILMKSIVPAAVSQAQPSVVPPADSYRTESGEHAVTLPDNRSVVDHLNISDPPEGEQSAPANEAETRPVGSVSPTQKKSTWTWPEINNSVLPKGFTLGTVEVAIILGLVNLLFLSFVIIQMPYLFGGMELVQNTPDFKLADYARRGFGELVAVSALVLPMLLASHWLIRKENPFTETLFRILAGIQIALLFVIMASAVQRLFLLTGNLGYGLTTVRLYPMIFMSWLAIVFIWFSLTVLRGGRNYFAWGALWSAFLILGVTHVLNPDEFIVKTNLALAQQGREFDADYNSNLSDDALPVLLQSFESLSADDQQTAVRRIGRRYCQKLEENDLRSWNYSRWRVSSMLNSNEQLAKEIGDCKAPTFAPPQYYD